MSAERGLYLTLLPEKKIKRDLAGESGRVSLEDTTILEELLQFLDLDDDPYDRAMQGIVLLRHYLGSDEMEEHEDAAIKFFRAITHFATVLAENYDEQCPAFSALLLTTLEDHTPQEMDTLEKVRRACADVEMVLYDTMFSRTLLGRLLQNRHEGKPLDFTEPFDAFQQVEARQIMSSDGVQYHFRSARDYYTFLFLHTLDEELRIQRCELCGHFFIPRTKRPTKYCNRVNADGRTCKEIAPGIRHSEKIFGTIQDEFERANRRMRQRYERALDINKKPSDKDLTYEEYLDWLEAAKQAVRDFKAGAVSLEEAKEIIDVP